MTLPTASVPAIALLAHEVRGQVVPGFGNVIADAAARLRRVGWSDAVSPDALLERSRLVDSFRTLGYHGALFTRFMVRGHWRRVPENWRDRSRDRLHRAGTGRSWARS